MKTQNLKSQHNLTEKESQIFDFLVESLNSYFGEEYSDIDCNDIAKALNIDVKSVKGIVGSLVKKGICGTWGNSTGYDVIYFVNQEILEL